MQLTHAEVKKIADLARIAISDEEVPKYQKELSAILDYVGQLNEVDTAKVEPTSQVTGLENQTRPDAITYTFTREQMMASAIETAEDHLKVKSVFKDKR